MFATEHFTSEDLSRLENRINVALFGVLAIPEFGRWFRDCLSLDESVVIRPARTFGTDEGSGRPDFVVEDVAHRTLAWIEVECWRDIAQLDRYRRIRSERIIGIWGEPDPRCDLSLREIQESATRHATKVDPQAQASLTYLTQLIDQIWNGGRQSTKAAPVTDEMWDSAFVVGMRERLGVLLTRGLERMRPGTIQIATTDTPDNRGFGVRVYSRRSSTRNSVSVLNRTSGRPEIRFSSQAWLEYYIPNKDHVIAGLREIIGELGGDVHAWSEPGIAGRGSGPRARFTSVPLDRAEEALDSICDVLTRLADPRA